MHYLIDTHIFLWWIDNNKKLSEKIKSVIANPSNIIFVSSVTTWEITIKKSLGKLEVPDNIIEIIEECGFETLSISPIHTLGIENLPDIHDDPFDRLLISQAICEDLILITNDQYIKQYDLKLLS
ncbi:MAG: type II toxin-antitoxin system VapC family toxin [Alphaproteobacteria bacterium]|nr:type II toxin-antitoxin system VapC family toxin [Alphaproteobacteria bacterium]OJV16045.1 MAG: twitching motility protein PilT [Alphaproteobacteria bacterium 33-17]